MAATLAAGQAVHADVGTLADPSGELVAWGSTAFGIVDNVPPGTYKAIGVTNSAAYSVRDDGTLVAWGSNVIGELNVPSGTFTAVSAGRYFGVGLRTDGTLVGWGINAPFGQASPPSGTFTAVAASEEGFGVALRTDGTLAAWGLNTGSVDSRVVSDVPSGVFTAVAAGYYHCLALRPDGTLTVWGSGADVAGTFTAVAGGQEFSLALRADGSIAAWGHSNWEGELNSPTGTFTAIAAGESHGLAIRADGTIAGWGRNEQGQADGRSDGAFVAIESSALANLALRARAQYEGDLIVSYSGSHLGPSGLKANLNRSINVAGDALIQSPMHLYNNPLAQIGGRLAFSADGAIVGDGMVNASGVHIAAGTTANLSGNLVLTSTHGLSGSGDLVLDGTHLTAALAPTSAFSGNLTINSGDVSFTGQGLLTPRSLTLGNGGELHIAAGQRLLVGAGSSSNAGRIDVLGNPHVLSGLAELQFTGAATNAAVTGMIVARDATLRFQSGLTNAGALVANLGVVDVFGDINNTGNITVTGGASATFYDDVTQNGTLVVRKLGSSTATAVFLGSFTGSGGFTGGGDVIVEGDLRPGNSPAAVTYDGNLSLGVGATTVVELGGLTQGSEYDLIDVSGQLSLDGVLEVALLGGFSPQLGNRFDILDFAALDGRFSRIELPGLNGGLSWDTSALYTDGSVTVVPEPASLALLAAGASLLIKPCRR